MEMRECHRKSRHNRRRTRKIDIGNNSLENNDIPTQDSITWELKCRLSSTGLVDERLNIVLYYSSALLVTMKADFIVFQSSNCFILDISTLELVIARYLIY